MADDVFSFQNSESTPCHEEESVIAVWNEFNMRFPTEEDCLEELCRRLFSKKERRCKNCGSSISTQNTISRAVSCMSCNSKCWTTAGTFFEGVRLVRPWLAAIWFLERGLIINSYRFHKMVGIAYSTALNIFRRITIALEERLGEDVLELPAKSFSELVCRRSRETPARSHPRHEQVEWTGKMNSPNEEIAEFLHGDAVDIKAKSVEMVDVSYRPPVELIGNEGMVLGALSEVPLHFDLLSERSKLSTGELSSCLTMLELDGLVVRLAGDFYVRQVPRKIESTNERNLLQQIEESSTAEHHRTAVLGALTFVRNTFRGISRKYLQNYLTAFFVHKSRHWLCLETVMDALIGSGRISRTAILDYVTPDVVKVLSSG